MICLNFIMSFSQTKNFTTVCLVLSGKQVVLCVISTYCIILYVTCASSYEKFIKSKQFNKRSQKKPGGRFYHYLHCNNPEEHSSKLFICFLPPTSHNEKLISSCLTKTVNHKHIFDTMHKEYSLHPYSEARVSRSTTELTGTENVIPRSQVAALIYVLCSSVLENFLGIWKYSNGWAWYTHIKKFFNLNIKQRI
jgi:hypothetical protein